MSKVLYTSRKLTVDDEALHVHLGFLQNLINRMAGNSFTAKTWCVTLVAAILVFAVDKDQPRAIYLGFLPVVVFMLFDAYYFGLERDFRAMYNGFVDDVHAGHAVPTGLFKLRPPSGGFWARLKTTLVVLFSTPSILPFYGAMAIALIVLSRLA